ncbi:MAG: leucyl/phenylalanyl-tRNA--protein transferase [Phycisphaerales bacterium]|nr:leucyl/phenylalanyl-tRNA--protein transferase [Phycisphaerales bacterium]
MSERGAVGTLGHVPSADLSPRTLLRAYASGAFPMTDADGVTRWYTADPRGVLPLEGFHCPKNLRQLVKQERFEIRIDSDFAGVMRGCRDVPRPESSGGWIGNELIDAYTELHQTGFAHSVEAWQKGQLVGGLYGVALGGAFFGESMFHQVANASKVCLVHLVGRLRERGYVLLDTQMVTGHMKQFGCVYVPAKQYEADLASAMEKSCAFT